MRVKQDKADKKGYILRGNRLKQRRKNNEGKQAKAEKKE